jgi:hypothetical protein
LIGLIDVDGKLPNLALMRISSYYKTQGEQVEFVKPGSKYEKIYASTIFTRSKHECEKLKSYYGNSIEIGGTGWDFDIIKGKMVEIHHTELPPEIARCKPDYELYTVEDIYPRICKGIKSRESTLNKAQEIVSASTGFTSRGCIRNCGFCFVPIKEGPFRQEAEIKELINPRSNVLILHDNNLTADPLCIDKLHEIRDRGLLVDINQGCDVRLMTPEIAKALSEVKHLRSVHYAWDLMGYEHQVLDGIKTLLQYVKAWRHMCFMLVGFNTTFEEDMYRFRKLVELGIKPYVMVYNDKPDIRLKCFEGWVNSRKHTACSWETYEPWVKAQMEVRLV